MAPQNRTRLSSLLLFIAGLHILLPVALSLVTLIVKTSQQQIVAKHSIVSGAFVKFQLKEVSASINDEKEFCYKGTMYDIKSVEVEHGAYVVYALPDKKETKLVKAKERAGGEPRSKVLPFVFLFHQPPPIFVFTINTAVTQQLGYYARRPLMTSIAVNGPPPRSVFIS